MDPQPTREGLKEFYSRSIESISAASNTANQERFDLICGHLGKHGNGRVIIDVGCNDGRFLSLFRKYGWNTIGLEPSSQVSEYVRRDTPNLTLISGFVPDAIADFPNGEISLVTMSHVLEHLPDPLETLRRLHAAKVDYLFLEVPNAAAGLYPRITREYGHLAYYTEYALLNLCAKALYRPLESFAFKNDSSSVIRLLLQRTSQTFSIDCGRKIFDSVSETSLKLADSRWKKFLRQIPGSLNRTLNSVSRGGMVALFGAGSDALRILQHWPQHCLPSCFIDNNPLVRELGKFLSLPVYDPSEINRLDIDAILVTPRTNVHSVRQILGNINDRIPVLDPYQNVEGL